MLASKRAYILQATVILHLLSKFLLYVNVVSY